MRYKIFDRKIVINTSSRVCETPYELITSELFKDFLTRAINTLIERKSRLLVVFKEIPTKPEQINKFIEYLKYLLVLPPEDISKILPDANYLNNHKPTLMNFIEFIYNYWRSFDRFVICNSIDDNIDARPYRTFDTTVEELNHLVRRVYRDIQTKLGKHPTVFRQLRAGAGMSAISKLKNIPMPDKYAEKLNSIPIIRQILLNPPLVLNPPMNKRTGKFEKIKKNPIDYVNLNSDEWLCYPVKCGDLTILAFINERFYEHGFTLANLFEISNDDELNKKPDGIFLFGVPGKEIDKIGSYPTVFYDDVENDLIIAAQPNRDELGYFGYLKKTLLTIHNIKKIKQGKLPFHGSFTRLIIEGRKEANVLIIGDTGAGKSETLEAFRNISGGYISDIIVIADDMGSIDIHENGDIVGYGTEIGAFLRLDDLSPDAAFGSIDRAIFMNTSEVNARVVIPVTSLYEVLRGTRIDFILYANNYEIVDEKTPVIEKFDNMEKALKVFREGASMAKGTTTAVGLQKTYFVNIFGPTEYMEEHDLLANKFFKKFFEKNIFVGQIRTQLAIDGKEKEGPMNAASELIKYLRNL